MEEEEEEEAMEGVDLCAHCLPGFGNPTGHGGCHITLENVRAAMVNKSAEGDGWYAGSGRLVGPVLPLSMCGDTM
jgi:hypothetical protein